MKRYRLLFSGLFLVAWVTCGSGVKAQDVASPCGSGIGGGPAVWVNGIEPSAWSMGLKHNDCVRLIQLWDAIGEDLKLEKNSLAGTYVKGGYNSGYLLRWSIKMGFIVIPYFDQNLITDYGYGTVTFVDDSKIIFTPAKQLSGGRGLDRMPQEWTAIWSYLVPVEELKNFGRFHAGLGIDNEFNGSCCEFAPIFLAQKPDAAEKSVSYPVPDKYKHFIQSPITGEIVFVGKTRLAKDRVYQGKLFVDSIEKAMLIPVRISAGNRQGVRRKMLFRLVGEPEPQYLQVTRVEKSTAWGYVVRDMSGGKETYGGWQSQKKSTSTIRVGTRVTTSPIRD